MRLSRNNISISVCLTVFSSLLLSYFIVPRPQLFSLLFFALEIYALELYISTNRHFYLFAIVGISIALVNFHSAMWIFYFLILIPYIIDGFKIHFLFVKTQGYGVLSLILTFIVSFFAGVLNPYGFENMFYVFKSYGNTLLNASIVEMLSPDFKSGLGIIVFILIVGFGLAYSLTRSSTRVRYALITAGTLYMGLSSLRSLALFLICGFAYLSYYMREFEFRQSKQANRKLVGICSFLIVVLLIGIFWIKINKSYEYVAEYEPRGAVDYILKNEDLSTIRLYNNYNTGGFIEFKGIKAFIDSRAEVFLKSVNQKDDIIIDEINEYRGKIHYLSFIKKYRFTHLLVMKGEVLDVYLKEDRNFTIVYQDPLFVIYKVADHGPGMLTDFRSFR